MREVVWVPKLSLEELRLGALAGVNRRIDGMRAGMRSLYRDGTEWTHEIESAATELAFAKHKGWYWSGISNFVHDVEGDGVRVQVRWTDRRDGSLIVRPRDSDLEGNPWYVLMVGGMGEYGIVGAMRASDARRDEWVRNPNGYGKAWFVPQSALRGPRA